MAVKFENSEELFSTQIGNIGLTAAAFDYFGLAEVIELCAGKTGSHVKVKQSEVVKLMCCQVLNVPYQSLYGTEEFYHHNAVRLDLNYRRKTIKNSNIWRLNNTLLKTNKSQKKSKKKSKFA